MDTVGIISNTPNCAEVVLNSLRNDEILGEDIKAIGDSTVGFDTCYNNDGDPKLRCTEAVLQGMRVGIPEAFVVQECSPKILKAWERAIEMLQANGASIETITDEVISSTDIRMSLPAYVSLHVFQTRKILHFSTKVTHQIIISMYYLQQKLARTLQGSMDLSLEVTLKSFIVMKRQKVWKC